LEYADLEGVAVPSHRLSTSVETLPSDYGLDTRTTPIVPHSYRASFFHRSENVSVFRDVRVKIPVL
jgi:hypothetical protein